jgi:hypothetical protein
MAHPYLSDRIEDTWEQPEHETFALLAERIEDYLAAKPMAMNEPEDLEYDVEHNVARCENYDLCECFCVDCIEH